jgi:hypothetical protein
MKNTRIVTLVGIALTTFTAPALAQVPLTLPQASPEASVTQVVGLTTMKVDYHRPAVNKRQIWGGLVPYGEVWRAGANENTTVTFSSPVKIGGKELAAGSYGLHMIPTAKEWTVAFSKMNVAWGSFSYDPKEDALRITVTPRSSPGAGFTERLSYSFDDPTDGSVQLVLHWEKLEVPIAIEVDTPAVVRASIQRELRGIQRFNWQPWNQAARYWLRTNGSVDEALAMADHSITMNENFQNLSTKAAILEKKGDAKAAADLNARAMGIATEADINTRGYELMGAGKQDEALALFQKNAKTYPKSWNAHDSLAEALLAKGDKKGAAASYTKALSLVKDETQKKRIEVTLKGLKESK